MQQLLILPLPDNIFENLNFKIIFQFWFVVDESCDDFEIQSQFKLNNEEYSLSMVSACVRVVMSCWMPANRCSGVSAGALSFFPIFGGTMFRNV